MGNEQQEATRRDLSALMRQMRGWPPERAAQAVWEWMGAQGFEQAHTPTRTVIQITPEAVQREYELRNGVTPTDDERIVRASIHGDVDAIRAFDRLLRRTVQGEPTDAQVLAALNEYEAWSAEEYFVATRVLPPWVPVNENGENDG